MLLMCVVGVLSTIFAPLALRGLVSTVPLSASPRRLGADVSLSGLDAPHAHQTLPSRRFATTAALCASWPSPLRGYPALPTHVPPLRVAQGLHSQKSSLLHPACAGRSLSGLLLRGRHCRVAAQRRGGALPPNPDRALGRPFVSAQKMSKRRAHNRYAIMFTPFASFSLLDSFGVGSPQSLA